MVEQEVKDILQYLAGAYPKLEFDGVGTALAWENGLNRINATYKECQDAVDSIIDDGYQDWEINLSLVIEIIRNKRQTEKEFIKMNKFLRECQEREKNKASYETIHNKIEKWKKEHR